MRPRVMVAAFVSLLATAEAVAQTAGDREQARTLANEGLTLFEKGAYQQAIDTFERAEALVHAPPHLLYIARARVKLGKLLAAREVYAKVAAEKLAPTSPRAFRAAQEEAGKELDALAEEIPRITVEVEGASRAATRVSVDGQQVEDQEIPLDPGEHEVVGEAEGMRAETHVTLAPGARDTIRLVLTPPEQADEEPASEGVPLAPIYVMAAGGLLLIGGGITGGLALMRADELKEACPQSPALPCDTQFEPLANEANALAIASTTFFVVGGVAAAVGGSWLIYEMTTRGDPEEESNARLGVGPGWVTMTGWFQ